MTFENLVLRRIFGQNRNEVTGGLRIMHNEELHNLYSPANIITIKSRGMGWARHVERMMRGGTYIRYGRKARRRGTIIKPRQSWLSNIKVGRE
jgi:hypothetical protein